MDNKPPARQPCQTCEKYKRFIQAMIDEFDKFKANKTAQYYKGQCEKILKQTATAPDQPET